MVGICCIVILETEQIQLLAVSWSHTHAHTAVLGLVFHDLPHQIIVLDCKLFMVARIISELSTYITYI